MRAIFRTIFLIFTFFIFYQNCDPEFDKYIEISVSSNSVSFGNINVNQYSDKTVTITNSTDSDDDLTGDISVIGVGFSIQSGGGNYSVKPGQSKTVTIRFSPTIIQTYSGTLTINHNSEEKSSPVNVQISGVGVESPVLTVSSTSLDFETSSTSETFSISNSGTGTLTWNVSESVLWITSVSPSSGSNSGTVTVQISRSGMSPGTYNGTISVTSNGGNQNVIVSMTILDSPVLSVSPTSLDFETSSTSKTFSISNSGTGTLSWNVSESVSWITSITPSTGSNSGTVTVDVSRDGISPGTYNGTISVTSNGGNQNVNVSMTVEENPVLSVSPTSLDFGTSSTSKTFSISNSGTGTLTWNVSESTSWITSVSPSSGSNSRTVTAQISRSGMSPGTYNGTISVTSNGGNQNVSVSMTVEENPVLSVSPTSLDFGTTSTSKTFSISNSGTGTLSWNVSESVSWITSVSPTSGSNNGTVTVQVSRSGMSPGTYNGTISVTSNGGNQNVSVSMTVEENPVLSVSPTSLDFGTTSTSKTFSISNSGTGTLTWNVSKVSSWITISHSSGTNSETITVQVSRDGLYPAIYNANIYVTSNGGDQNVSVSMTVEENPVLSVSPTSLDFGMSSTSKTFSISNSGTGTLSWNVSESVSWITSVSPTSGSNSGTVTVQVSRSGMSPGTYNGTVSVTSNGGSENVSVEMTVEEKEKTLYSADDTFVNSALPNNDFSDYKNINIGWSENNGISIALIDFNVTDNIPENSYIVKATLYLTSWPDATIPTSVGVKIGIIKDNWNSWDVTWSTTPTSKIVSDYAVYLVKNFTTQLDVTDEVQAMSNGRNTVDSGYNEGFKFIPTQLSGSNVHEMAIYSKEYEDVSKRPKLVIKYTSD